MTCPHAPTKIHIKFNERNEIQSFSFEGENDPVKDKDLENFCLDMTPESILSLQVKEVFNEMMISTEEDKFFLCLRLDAIQCAMAAYIGAAHKGIDAERCIVEEIRQTNEGNTMSAIILPPQDFPQIQ